MPFAPHSRLWVHTRPRLQGVCSNMGRLGEREAGSSSATSGDSSSSDAAFHRPVEALRDVPALAWYGSAAGVAQEPHLVWPQDQAWCLACEVDEEIEFTVGCSGEPSQALARALPGAVRRVRYGEPAPMYRDPA
jgi:hypothetical protein